MSLGKKNKQYDIVFMGHLCTATIFPFRETLRRTGWPGFFWVPSSSCLGKRIAAVTRIADNETELLEPWRLRRWSLRSICRDSSISHLFSDQKCRWETSFSDRGGGHFSYPWPAPIEPCLSTFGGLSIHEFSLEFMRELKERGFRLSVDMWSFVKNVDEEKQLGYLADVPEKKEILSMVDFVKVDVMEAKHWRVWHP